MHFLLPSLYWQCGSRAKRVEANASLIAKNEFLKGQASSFLSRVIISFHFPLLKGANESYWFNKYVCSKTFELFTSICHSPTRLANASNILFKRLHSWIVLSLYLCMCVHMWAEFYFLIKSKILYAFIGGASPISPSQVILSNTIALFWNKTHSVLQILLPVIKYASLLLLLLLNKAK